MLLRSFPDPASHPIHLLLRLKPPNAPAAESHPDSPWLLLKASGYKLPVALVEPQHRDGKRGKFRFGSNIVHNHVHIAVAVQIGQVANVMECP